MYQVAFVAKENDGRSDILPVRTHVGKKPLGNVKTESVRHREHNEECVCPLELVFLYIRYFRLKKKKNVIIIIIIIKPWIWRATILNITTNLFFVKFCPSILTTLQWFNILFFGICLILNVFNNIMLAHVHHKIS